MRLSAFLPAALGAALLASGAVAVAEPSASGQTTVSSPSQQQARAPVAIAAREEDTRLDDWARREYMRRIRSTRSVQAPRSSPKSR